MTTPKAHILAICPTSGTWRAFYGNVEGQPTNRRLVCWALTDSMTGPVDERVKVVGVVIGDDGTPTLADRCGQVRSYNSSADVATGMAKVLP